MEELTTTHKRFLADLRASTTLIITMVKLVEKYQENQSKAQTKRDILWLIDNNFVTQTKMKTVGYNGRYTSSTIYTLTK